MRLEPSGNLRYGRVAGLVLADPNEAAAASDLEGTPGGVDRVGDIHGRSLSDSLGHHPESGEALWGECYRRAMPPTTSAMELS